MAENTYLDVGRVQFLVEIDPMPIRSSVTQSLHSFILTSKIGRGHGTTGIERRNSP
jgi:hypothetical protein